MNSYIFNTFLHSHKKILTKTILQRKTIDIIKLKIQTIRIVAKLN